MNKNYFEGIGALPSGSGLLNTYFFGFLLSLFCTFIAYELVAHQTLQRGTLVAVVVILALVQCATQVMCFLHVGLEKRSRLKLLVLCFGVLVVGILVSGSLWIMTSLNTRMTLTPTQMDQHMQREGGF